MNNIKWEEGAVCFANGMQHIASGFLDDFLLAHCLTFDDFQLNEISTGDYIKASELDTEQKYNDAVEDFELFGYKPNKYHEGYSVLIKEWCGLEIYGGEIYSTDAKHGRKITYPQLMSIGKLKRIMIKSDKSAPKIAPDLTPDVEIKDDWSDEHYNHFYKLTEEDIKAGQIKVDAYFVNRMWKINSWEDTGAGFHILKTLPRIANNKNSLKRELVALKKQVDILCKLHGVNDDTN